MAEDKVEQVATLSCARPEAGKLRITLAGRLDAEGAAAVWPAAEELVQDVGPVDLLVDAGGVDYCDGAGLALILHLERLHRERSRQAGGREFQVQHLPQSTKRMLERVAQDELLPRHDRPERTHFLEDVGRASWDMWQDTRDLVQYVGQLTSGLVQSVLHPHTVRWRDAFLAAERAGVDALPIIGLISFLLGMIMGFQSAIPLERFGAEKYVAELVSISMVRELGPLMTALLLAGRSASRFAAEIGTMKVNEEIDALTTMGLDPLRFLVVPRVLALVVLTPLLALFADFMGLVGGATVYCSFGLPLVGFLNQVQGMVTLTAVFGGLFKAFVFGVLVAAIGCRRGLQAGRTPSSVGDAATRAVVTSILLVVVADGVLAVAYYILEI